MRHRVAFRNGVRAAAFLFAAAGACHRASAPTRAPTPADSSAAIADPTLLPPIDPVDAPLQGLDGMQIVTAPVDRGVGVRFTHDSPRTTVGSVEFTLVWIGPATGGDARPWRAVAPLANGCTNLPPTVAPNWTSTAAFGSTATSSIQWRLDPAMEGGFYCNGHTIGSMAPPAGRYRVRAVFRAGDAAAPQTVWSAPFSFSL